jgi:hypothetical protein
MDGRRGILGAHLRLVTMLAEFGRCPAILKPPLSRSAKRRPVTSTTSADAGPTTKGGRRNIGPTPPPVRSKGVAPIPARRAGGQQWLGCRR